MLRDGWNFHGDIAISLEGDARSFFGDIDRPVDKIYDADAIELGSFAEVMILLLRQKTDFSNECPEIDEFISKCGKYVGVSGNQIPKETAQALYDEFTSMFN